MNIPKRIAGKTISAPLNFHFERIYPLIDPKNEEITAAGIDRAEVAVRLLDTYLQQIFEDGFVHADPHPGNLFITPLPQADGEPVKWQLTFVDFGMVARVPDSIRDSLRELVIAVGTRDASRVPGRSWSATGTRAGGS